MPYETKTHGQWRHDPPLVFEHPVTRTKPAGDGLNRKCADCGERVALFTVTTTKLKEAR
jgi:hypothetical protein